MLISQRLKFLRHQEPHGKDELTELEEMAQQWLKKNPSSSDDSLVAYITGCKQALDRAIYIAEEEESDGQAKTAEPQTET